MQNSLLRTDKEVSQIYYRHVNTVYRVCFMFMKNKNDTEDMVQNTFLKLMSDKTQFQSEEHEKAWLIRTATNLCKDHFRHWWTKTIAINDAAEAVTAQAVTAQDNIIDDTLDKVLALPDKYKTVVYMYYYEGYSTVEIAKMLSKNESTIRSRLHTGRKLLKLEMEDDSK